MAKRIQKKEKILEKILNEIKENKKIVFIQDVYQVMGMPRSTFYRMFPGDSEEKQVIDETLETNKTSMKREIRDRLMESKHPAALLSLYRLLGTKEERQILSQKEYEDYDNNKTEIELKIE